MPTVKSTMDTEELTQTLGISLATLYRRLAESRKGIGTLPLPINMGGNNGGRKRRLLWSRDAIMAFLQKQNSEAPQPSLNFMSETERRKRNAAACQSLRANGVKLNAVTK